MERNEAIGVVKRNYPHVTESGSQFETALRILIPELKESEDERVRKALIDFFYRGAENGEQTNGVCDKDILAWLEKQGEQILANSAKNCKDEQKPAEKVEPKFHEGDWVILSLVGEKDKLVQVQTVEHFPSGQPRYITANGKWFENGANARLWTIKDAKNGDVLVTIDDERPFIYKGCLDPNHPDSPVAYCGIDSKDYFICSCIDNFNSWWTGEKVLPATKEQREDLLKAMVDAGYEFDFEKKELKKIEDETEIPFGAKDSESQEATYFIPKGFHAEIDDDKVVIKKGEKQAEWSEEDEMIALSIEQVMNCASLLNIVPEKIDKIRTWLKSRKERVSKFDDGYKVGFSAAKYSQWKPSDGQISLLQAIINDPNNAASESCQIVLKEVIKQLKKLRKE